MAMHGSVSSFQEQKVRRTSGPGEGRSVMRPEGLVR